MLDEQMVQDELKAYEKNLTDAQKERLHHERQLLQTQQRLSAADPNNWTNKFASMSLDDMKTVPYGYMKKYGSMINFIIRMDKEAKVQENKQYMGYYDRIKNQKALQTNEEKQAYQEWRDLMHTEDVVHITDLIREEGDYFKRQPRIDPSELSYNFE